MFPRSNFFSFWKMQCETLHWNGNIYSCKRWEGIFNFPDVERFSLRANLLLCISGYDKKGFIEGRETIPHKQYTVMQNLINFLCSIKADLFFASYFEQIVKKFCVSIYMYMIYLRFTIAFSYFLKVSFIYVFIYFFIFIQFVLTHL